jgi:hypothetical protein
MRTVVIIVAFMMNMIAMTDARHRLAMPRNYVKNLNKAVENYCNMEAFKKVRNETIYNCFKTNMNNCKTLANYSEFNEIRSECIDIKNSEYGYGIMIGIMFWVFLSICAIPCK